jgi:hypothetical protein
MSRPERQGAVSSGERVVDIRQGCQEGAARKDEDASGLNAIELDE